MAVEYKRPLGDLNARHGGHGGFSGDVPAAQLLGMCKQQGDAVRNAPPRRHTACHLGKEAQQIEDRPLLVDQQVSPADLAVPFRGPDSGDAASTSPPVGQQE